MITLRFGSSVRTRKIDAPPMPSSGLRIDVAVLRRRRRGSRIRSRVTSVGAVNCGNSRDRELLVVVAHRARIVEHARALALGELQQVGGVDVLHVEGRVLAHQHGVEVPPAACAVAASRRVPVVRRRRSSVRCRRARHAAHDRRAISAILRCSHGVQLVAARGRLAHHRVGGVLVGLEVVKRIEDEGDVSWRCSLPCGAGQWRSAVQRGPGRSARARSTAASSARRATTPYA